MKFHELKNWILKKINVKLRLQAVFFFYLISLMLETRKHSITFASEMSGVSASSFSKFLMNNDDIAMYTLEDLSKTQAKQFSKIIKKMKSLPWKICIIIDDVIQGRSSTKSDNVQKFNHGNGYVIGHQWTNIILLFNDIIIPLPPIPFYTKKYCRENKIEYKTRNDKLVEYLNGLNLDEYIYYHEDSDVIVLADSGFDDKKIQNTIISKGWHFITALKSSRGLKSEAKYAKTGKSSGWDGAAVFFKKYRKLAWETVRIFTDGQKKKRMDFRIRHTEVFLKNVGKIIAVCSEFKKKRDGRRKYIACSDLKAAPLQILTAYRLRWKIEIFHKNIKMHLGFDHIAAKHFKSVETHVYLVYCAYLLLHDLPCIDEKNITILKRQRKVAEILENKKTASIIQKLTRIGGAKQYKDELKSALAS